MLKLAFTAAALAAFVFADGAGAAPRPAAAPARPARVAKADPGKLRDCELAWERQRIKKGSKKAFIRACVRHG